MDAASVFGLDSTQLTPFHLLVLLFSCLALLAGQLDIPYEFELAVGMWQRGMVLLVGGMVMYHVIVSSIANYQEAAVAKLEKEKTKDDIRAEMRKPKPGEKTDMAKASSPWSNPSSHPSAFLTTKDGKPRLFPFPLGKAGSETKDLWWEAGNSAHVGHFNQKETPEAKEALRIEMEKKDAARLQKAKKVMDELEGKKKKWLKRLSHLKVICGIVIIGVFHRTIGVLCLVALIYYIFATELAKLLKSPDPEEEPFQAVRRKKVPNTPGMAMTYLYEPTTGGGLAVAGAIPTKAPSHRLMTSLDSRYAS